MSWLEVLLVACLTFVVVGTEFVIFQLSRTISSLEKRYNSHPFDNGDIPDYGDHV